MAAIVVVPFIPPQPPAFQWTTVAAIQLIRERRTTHWQFDRIANRNHNNIWTLIANRIFAATGFVATAQQCRTKWAALKRGYENLTRILLGNEDEFPIQSPNNFDRSCFDEMNDEFWLQTDLFRREYRRQNIRNDRRRYEYRYRSRSPRRERRRSRSRSRDRRRRDRRN